MTAATAIARKDWREFVRDRRLLLLAALTALLALAAIATSAMRVSAYEADRRATEASDRATWEGQGARNPHGAAHFSSWAFRPLSAGALLDPGVTPYAGSAIWMEAHNQNPARARPIEDQADSFDFGHLSAAWILQTVAPLLLLVVGAGLVARERERGTLRLMLVSGADAGALVPGKLFGLGGVALLLVLPVLIVAYGTALLLGREGTDPFRLILWVLAYLTFFAVVLGVAVVVSTRAGTVSQAMLVLIGLWLMAVVAIPRAGAALAQAIAPTPNADAFWASVAADREKQPDVFGDAADAFTATVARRYGVARKEDLPVNLSGLQLEEDERLGNIVYKKHYDALARTYAEQRAVLRVTGLVSPLASLQNLSMALAGTDVAHQLDFQAQAESHRRRTISQLNGDMAANAGSADFDYRADAALWKSVPTFAYMQSSLARVLATVWADALILLGWLIAAGFLVLVTARRVARGAL